ncbi:MAG: hypothetical protein Q7T74_06840 [Candidatus Saccharibacteria bacterium]|nr:hypothetical protein [Candidatus Saccharibacteria bacterium]
MRKEAKISIFTTLVILAIIANIDNIFNAVAGLFLSGYIPGTHIVIPSMVVFASAVLAISTMLVLAVRKHLPSKYVIKLLRGRVIHIDGKHIRSYSV